jgi:hypothetical protein
MATISDREQSITLQTLLVCKLEFEIAGVDLISVLINFSQKR